MSSALQDMTVLPPDELGTVRHLLEAMGPTAAPALVGPDGTHLELPDEAYRVLREVLEAMAQGLAITIMPQHTLLTTQEAADLLRISRPTLVKLLDEGAIPHSTRGRHRRLKLVDVLAYERQAHVRRQQTLGALVADAEENDLYETTVDPASTR